MQGPSGWVGKQAEQEWGTQWPVKGLWLLLCGRGPTRRFWAEE